MVRCIQCGHCWIESGPTEVIDINPRQLPVPAGYAPLPVPATVMPMEGLSEEEREVERLAELAREARAEFAEARRRRRKKQLGWATLIVAALSPIGLAFAMPETTVKIAPSTIRLFDKVGMPVNIYGLELRRIDRQHMMVDGMRVIAIKGDILNVSDAERKVPSLRFTLRDKTGKPVYAWTLDSTIRPLRSGESSSFVTRVASPPEGAADVEIRFAHADEIGSNTVHEPR
jgi:hypothetical protein